MRLSPSVTFDVMHERDRLRDAYLNLVSTLPQSRAAIREAMAECKRKGNTACARRLEALAHEHFATADEAAAWCRVWHITGFRSQAF